MQTHLIWQNKLPKRAPSPATAAKHVSGNEARREEQFLSQEYSLRFDRLLKVQLRFRF